ncbi:integral membrane protein S linking to the trans Golgi network-domain-containing protein [Cantharellus anzutake]|uniref:integral membrane protein S linking to the trans Golgi network-domain-containing protein n=1 Tax=Cantharellus anzutake TaxID=1750568 RepID=UPI0019072933|nr:integral membrane protein S linking to the trans Golgi network-domain-containing protein [Cantharellus anzutake]KAF8327805.1 integral membrane protein S linking to the trans Golgi network-domain-containing protein [Cantharellus anzutake]
MWDPVLLIAQIISLQSLHYLTLCVILPPLLYLFTTSLSLRYYNGGATTVGMIMDWREMASRPTVGRGVSGGGWDPFESAWKGVVRVSQSEAAAGESGLGGWKNSFLKSVSSASTSLSSDPLLLLRPSTDDGTLAPSSNSILIPGSSDPTRGWIIAFAWLLACAADTWYLYHIVRRPRYILDFALTLVLNHFILTSYYSSSFPTSLFFWFIMGIGALFVIIFAEYLCVQREMREGLKSVRDDDLDDHELRRLDDVDVDVDAISVDDEGPDVDGMIISTIGP